MLIISFFDVFHNTDFKEKFKHADFDRVRKRRWVCTSTIPAVQIIVHMVSEKSGDVKQPVPNSTIKDKEDVLLNKLRIRKASQTIWASLAIHNFARKSSQIV